MSRFALTVGPGARPVRRPDTGRGDREPVSSSTSRAWTQEPPALTTIDRGLFPQDARRQRRAGAGPDRRAGRPRPRTTGGCARPASHVLERAAEQGHTLLDEAGHAQAAGRARARTALRPVQHRRSRSPPTSSRPCWSSASSRRTPAAAGSCTGWPRSAERIAADVREPHGGRRRSTSTGSGRSGSTRCCPRSRVLTRPSATRARRRPRRSR